ncbi:hypothetical protein [Bifidobacterium thermophilum]|uniref:Uncharacterized protein n=1 Tax=Bifidobacterium thermophilum TaxID=33905 RepID=A0A7X9NQE2_9BIFI|nr:hypothetical protein [Bifidobacterium thermophilum]NME61898.1 hypothetical protein [Bifidobacterium thermophilum]
MNTLMRFLLVVAAALLAGAAAFAASVTPPVCRLAAGVMVALLVGFVGVMAAVSCVR